MAGSLVAKIPAALALSPLTHTAFLKRVLYARMFVNFCGWCSSSPPIADNTFTHTLLLSNVSYTLEFSSNSAGGVVTLPPSPIMTESFSLRLHTESDAELVLASDAGLTADVLGISDAGVYLSTTSAGGSAILTLAFTVPVDLVPSAGVAWLAIRRELAWVTWH
ncbi:hypothetical protein T492DRAFT_841279 [Pavlovales sp. CCMP2436]|nr:hypothetical protein T492DRAFT_841279 [Pavlovales sp. CCMP2436]